MLKNCPWFSTFMRQYILPTYASNTWVRTIQRNHTHTHTYVYMDPSLLVLPLFLKGIIHLTAGYCVCEHHTVHVLQFSSSDLRNKAHSFQRMASDCLRHMCSWDFKMNFAKVPIYIAGNKRHFIYMPAFLCILIVASSRSCNVRFV